MARRISKSGLLKIDRQLLKACGITKPTNNELVDHAVYNDWKLAIRLFLRIKSFNAANLRVPSELLIQLLDLATKVGSKQIVEMLLPLDEDLLWKAIQVGSPDIVALLVQNGASVDPPIVQGRHLLDYAVYYKNVEVIEILLKANANVNARNDYGGMPIHMAASLGYLDCIKLLKEYGADINSRGFGGCRPIHYAVSDTSIEIVQYLLQNGAEVNSKDDDGVMPIHIAAHLGCTSSMKLLIENGANVLAKGINGWLPLHNATYSKNIKAVQLLIDNGGNTYSTSEGGNTPIDLAITGRSESIFRLFVKNDATISRDSIQMAIENHCVEMIEPLIEHGLDVNEKIGPFGNTAIHEAMKCGCEICIEAMKICIKFGANPYIKDNEGKTSIENALSIGRLDIFKLLSQT